MEMQHFVARFIAHFVAPNCRVCWFYHVFVGHTVVESLDVDRLKTWSKINALKSV